MPMGGAIAGGAVIGGVTSLVGSGKQADATNKATEATSASAANSLAFNNKVYADTQNNETPYRNIGNEAANQLSSGLSSGELTKGYGPQFSFSGVNQANDPAYQFDLQQGQQAIQRSAAAGGGLVSGGALKDLDQYSQGYASNQYQQSYSNALAQYQQAYNQFETTQGNKYNRLASTAGLGQSAVTGTATSGNAAASNNAYVSTNAANSIANLTTAQGTANAAAFGSAGNAIQSGLNSYANTLALQSGSSYNANNAAMGGGLFQNSAPVSQSQWNAYDATRG